MHDIVIRGGTIVDGTGEPAFTGDVAIAGGRIAAVGGKAGPARTPRASGGRCQRRSRGTSGSRIGGSGRNSVRTNLAALFRCALWN